MKGGNTSTKKMRFFGESQRAQFTKQISLPKASWTGTDEKPSLDPSELFTLAGKWILIPRYRY